MGQLWNGDGAADWLWMQWPVSLPHAQVHVAEPCCALPAQYLPLYPGVTMLPATPMTFSVWEVLGWFSGSTGVRLAPGQPQVPPACVGGKSRRLVQVWLIMLNVLEYLWPPIHVYV